MTSSKKLEKVEKSLLEEEEFIKLALNSQRDTFFVFNPKSGEALLWNKAFSEVSGYTDEEIKALKAPDSYYSVEDLKKATKAATEVIEMGRTTVEMELITKDGKKIPYEYTGTSIPDSDGYGLIVSIGRNITERKSAERDLRESEEKFRGITDQSLMSISVIQDGLIKYVNDRVPQINGYSREELYSWGPYEFMKLIHPNDKDFVLEQVKKKQAGDSDVVTHYKYRLIRKDKEIRWIENFSKTIIYEGKTADLVTTIDITDKIEAEQKLRESEERYRLIAQNSDLVVWVSDMNLNLTYVSPNSPKILGYTAEEIISSHISQKLNPESLNRLVKIFREEVKKERKKDKNLNRSRTFETEQIHKNGDIIPVEITFTFLRDENNNATGFLGVSRDISERKKAEQKLKESETLFRDLYEEAPNAYFSIRPDKSIIRCNKAAENLLGYTKEELLKMKVFDLYYKGKYGREKAKNLFNRFLQGEYIKDVELKMRNKKGEPVWISLSVKPIYDQEGNVIESRSMILDINERKLAQEELKNSYEKLKEMEYIVNNSPGVLFLWKNMESWPVEFVSENVKQFGYTQEDFYSGKITYGQLIHPNDLERVNEEIKKHSQVDINEFIQEYRIITKSGEEKWLDDRTWIRRDKNGNITHFEGIVIDITDRKLAEAALKLSEKMFKEAYDMANFYKDLFTHDMNNILQVINSSAEIISFQLGDSEKSIFIENMTKMIKSQIDRGSKLISDVRTLTSLDEEEISKEKINISKFLKKSINFMKKAYSERKVSFIVEELSDEYYTSANELLQDVFDNILMNGIKYNENEVIEIKIDISKQEINKKSYIQIEFIDNGIGIHDDRKELIFQPGNREFKGSKGMGIGLSLVSKIIEIFNGKIWVEDKVRGDYSQGSKFIILLPEKA